MKKIEGVLPAIKVNWKTDKYKTMDHKEPGRSILLTNGANPSIHVSDYGENNAHAGCAPASSNTGNNIQIVESPLPRGRGRSREKRNSVGGGTSNTRSLSTRSISRSRIEDESYLKWTVLRRDPSERLHKDEENDRGESAIEDDDYDEDDVSDEEQISDIENDQEIDSELDYDLGARVLPNFSTSISNVLESNKPWTKKYLQTVDQKAEHAKIKLDDLPGGYMRAMSVVTRGKGGSSTHGSSYILYADLSSESMYALTYTLGAVVNSGDTLYVVHVESSTTETRLLQNIDKFTQQAAFLLDCSSGVVNDLSVVLLSLSHPYPKHLVNQMIHGLKPLLLVVSLSLVLTSLQNYVCNIPTLVVRKKLKRSKRRGIYE